MSLQLRHPDPARVEAFRAAILPAETVLVVTHDYPDPDCLASAHALQVLFAFWGIRTTTITYGGFAGRAENRAMMALLDIRTIPFLSVDFSAFERIVCVDCFPGKGNVSLPNDLTVHAVFDHHPLSDKHELSCYCDIREEVAATSTLMVEYLVGAGCTLPTTLATALYYGIKTDTGDMLRDVSADDLAAYQYVFERMNYPLLARIERPERDVGYYTLIHRALENARIVGSVGFIDLEQVSTPDSVAEMADFFFSCDRFEWIFCAGSFTDRLFFSIRSKNSLMSGCVAEKLAETLGGSGGGHTRFAAGQIPLLAPYRQLFSQFVESSCRILRMKQGGDELQPLLTT